MTQPDVVYLELEDLLVICEGYLGHPAEVRDFGLLESALARPKATVFGDDAYPGIHEKAAALLDSVVNNHALVDGNKRLGWVATRLFYGFNGYWVSATEDQKVDLVLDVAAGEVAGVADIAKRLSVIFFRG
ncbi:type II toxin-antitoxin system death-on-curing family toxin [Mycobacterium sp. CBMA271]|uniref:type II toxin-antitoxin system death-on-curing family toxin n=1 Tax=unclassified Mycobacteroides TaxID=2618759 RepID=UPI0012DCE51C|nr:MULTISPECIES: type II toxin-antitoxin system death-on-curing family toxin [unclassified Mycobacteroides]MUM15856.1 death-on-curing protein [Mycobacteroides sp. CBMA 326]MUM24467.1 type II toxin-antitoxin system death-on-curing family toxin [Mycobacteroides sp. CBMA 271]